MIFDVEGGEEIDKGEETPDTQNRVGGISDEKCSGHINVNLDI